MFYIPRFPITVGQKILIMYLVNPLWLNEDCSPTWLWEVYTSPIYKIMDWYICQPLYIIHVNVSLVFHKELTFSNMFFPAGTNRWYNVGSTLLSTVEKRLIDRWKVKVDINCCCQRWINVIFNIVSTLSQRWINDESTMNQR